MSSTAVIVTTSNNAADVAATIDAATAPATRKAYASAMSNFAAYCDAQGWLVWPTSQEDAEAFVVHVVSWLQVKVTEGCSVSTITKLLSGIKYHAARESFVAASALAVHPGVKSFTEGVARLGKGAIVKQAAAFTRDDIRNLYASLRTGTGRDLRNRALIGLGIGAALRAQSIADLRRGDITVVTVDSRPAYTLRVRWSKTDQTGAGHIITIKPARHHDVDPVEAITAWLAHLDALHGATGLTATEKANLPLFPHVRGASVQIDRPIAAAGASDALTDLVRHAVVKAGITDDHGAAAYSSHSLRSTFITLAAQHGVSEARVAAVTGHKNLNVLRRYDRTTSERMAQADYLD